MSRIRSDYLTGLRQILATHFDEGELRTLCFDLHIDYDDLPGAGKVNKARELVAYLERHGQIPNLLEVGKQLRPDVVWGNMQALPDSPSALQNVQFERPYPRARIAPARHGALAQQIKAKVAQDELEDALKLYGVINEMSAIALLARLERTKRDSQFGVITRSEANAERSTVAHILLEAMSEVRQEK
jgi:hypothetical protein